MQESSERWFTSRMARRRRARNERQLRVEPLEERIVLTLVAAYSFNEGAGALVADTSGNANTGTINGATWSTGRFGSGLSFDGVDDLVTISDSDSLDLTTGLTLEAWVNPSASGNVWRDVIFKADDMYFLEGSSRRQGRPAWGGTFANPLYGTSALPLNTWSHLAATYDGATMRLYVDGIEVNSRPRTGLIETSDDSLTIGGDNVYGQHWAGLIDEVRIYDRALSQAEIQIEMNSPLPLDTKLAAVPEESANGTAVDTVTGDDVDLPGDPVSYAIIAGDPSNGFAIDASGNITIADNSVLDLDFDDGTDFVTTVTVEVSDGANTDTVDVIVLVTPINDNTPDAGSDFSTTIRESSPNGTFVAAINVADLDLPGDTLTYAIIAGDPSNGFSIDATGTISIANASVLDLDFDDGTDLVATLTAEVSDGANTDAVDVTVHVVPASLGLVAAYSFDEGTGSLVDDASGTGNSGTITGATWTTGRFENALSFDGIDDLVTVNDDNSLDLTTGLTLEAWVNPSTSSNAWRDVIYKADDIYFLEGSSTQAGVPAWGGTFSSPLFGASSLPANAWSHLAATYDGVTMRLYVDGVEVASQVQTAVIQTSDDPLTIGGNGLYGQYWAGLIDEVRIYSRALSQAEILVDMNTGVTPNTKLASVPEESPNGTVVDTVTVADVDLPGNPQSFAIIAGDPNNGFAIDATGNITINDAGVLDLDFDDGTDFVATLTVEVSDGANIDTVDVTVQVTPINDNAPNAGADFSTNIPEESENGAAVATVSATDLDLPGDTLSYAITAGDPGNGFAVDAAGNITIADASVLDLDFDDGTDLVATLTVEVSDGVNTDTVDVTVQVTPTNDNTPDAGADFSTTISEESGDTTAVATVSATDLDLPGDTLSYVITAGDPSNGFAVDAAGNITIADASVLDLDFDDGTDLVTTLTVEVSDGANTDTVDVTVQVSPVNDNTPDAGADFSTTIPEESGNGTAVATVSATDLDLPGDTLSYAIIAGDPNNGFAIDAAGNITIADASVLDLDFDDGTDLVATLTVEVSDGANSDTVDVTVRVTPSSPNTKLATIPEESPNGTVVDTVTAADVDLPGNPQSFAIIAGDPNNGFAIDATGNITINDAGVLDLDFDDGTDFVATLTVEVSDGANIDTVDVTVQVTPINDNAPNAGADFSTNIPEESGDTTSVATASATDLDLPGDTLSYAITAGDPNSGFAIDADGKITIADASVLDLDFDDGTDLVATLTVEVSDGVNTDTVDVTVQVTPINDNTPDAGADFSTTIPEESGDTTSVATVSATDLDLPGDTLSYAITAGDPNSGFAIDADGKITIADASVLDLDFDDGTDLVATLTVEVSDGVNTDTVDVTVQVTPINDNTPDAGTDFSTNIPEESGDTTAVATVSATDLDLPGDTLSYAITAGNPNSGFAIDADGNITIADASVLDLDFDDGTELVTTLTVQVSDGVNTDTVDVTVQVTPINDNTPDAGADFSTTIPEESGNGTAVATVSATDLDLPGDTLSYTIIAGDPNNGFAVDAAGNITIANASVLDLDFDDGTDLVATLTVEVSDGVNSDTVDVTVRVTPSSPNTKLATVPEESPNGTLVDTVTAADVDLPSNPQSFTIIAGDPNNGFAIDATGNITINDASVLDLDFDDGTDFVATLTVEVSDGTNTDTVDVTVQVTPINDNSPDAGADFNTIIPEESGNTTAVATVSATDLDLPGDTLSYAITAGDPSSGFAIDAAGNITIAEASVLDLDFDDGTNLVATLTVEVSDGVNTDTVDVTVQVTPINDNTPDAGADFSTTIPEESGNTTAVATVSATDLDLPGDTLSYAITSGDPSNGFAIDAAGNITIADASVLDLDFDDGTDLVATLTVEVSDGANTDTVDVTVQVTPMNDNTPDAGADFNTTIPEESGNTTAVATVSATDVDLPGDTLSYTITAGDPSNGFAVDVAGNITIADASVLDLNFDDGTDLVTTLTVEVSDGANTDTVDVTVQVTPINDNTPDAGADFSSNVPEDSLNGTSAGAVSATDLDLPGDTLSYTIIAGDPNNGFAIDALGNINIADASVLDLDLDDGTDLVATLTVEVSDGANTDTVDVTVRVVTSPVGLVAAYSFDEGAGALATDFSGSGNNGTISGATWAAGQFNNALSFDGIDDLVTVTDADSLDATAELTLEAWVNPGTSISKWRDVIFKADDIYYLEGSSPQGGVPAWGGTFTSPLFGTSALTPNSWSHLAATYDGATMRLYVDAVEVASRPQTGLIETSNNPLAIGGDGVYGQYWAGLIDEVRVYNRALGPAEIQSDMNTSIGSGVPDSTPPSVAITTPSPDANLSHVVEIVASASDDVGVVGVEFFVDGLSIGADPAAPYTANWNSTLATNGSHTITAVARDAGGNLTTSAAVAIDTFNPAFINEVVVPDIIAATTIAFLPDGRLLIGELTETIWVLQSGASQVDPIPFLQLDSSNLFDEQGLMDIILDPGFAQNSFYYVFYTKTNPSGFNFNRVSRFTASGNGTVPGSEFVVWQDDQAAAGEHHGGALAFGQDGKLYITTGEHFNPPDSQLLTNYRGKVLRVNSDGTIPLDNPFHDGAGPNKDAIWAYGLRNPFRMSIDPVTGNMYIGDVGGNDHNTAFEEINLGVAGANYGWPLGEGAFGVPGTTPPIYSYPHNGRDASITGGFVYRGTQFPSTEYVGSYFFADYVQNTIKRLTFDGNGDVTSVVDFWPADGSPDGPLVGDPVKLIEGIDGAIYYVDIGFNDQHVPNEAAIRRIRYEVENQVPVAVASANPTAGLPPLAVAFSSAGSFDPDGEPLSFDWDFGDGATSTAPNPMHTYQAAGSYDVTLVVSDGVDSSSDQLTITVGNVPIPTILTPADGSLFRAGDVINYSGTANDVEDGDLPASAFQWQTLFHHDSHIHPGPITTNTKTGSLTIPTTGHDFQGATHYQIVLTVTDSDGLSNSTSVDIFPDKVNLTFDTLPSGLTVEIDGISKQTPFVFDQVIGFQHTINAPAQSSGGIPYDFVSWSDGGAQSHPIVVPSSNQTYIAEFAATGAQGLVAGYGFEEGSGTTTADASANGNTGTISGATWTAAGRYGNALSFDGSSSLVTVNDAPSLDLTTALTLEAWVNPSTVSSAWRDIIYKANDVIYFEGTSTQSGVPAWGGTFGSPLYGTSSLPVNTWSHLAATYDGTTMRLYVDAVEVASRPQTGLVQTSNNPLTIGGDNVYGQHWAGMIDEVRIYNRALTQAEIQADMNTPVSPPSAAALEDATPEEEALEPVLNANGLFDRASRRLRLSSVSRREREAWSPDRKIAALLQNLSEPARALEAALSTESIGTRFQKRSIPAVGVKLGGNGNLEEDEITRTIDALWQQVGRESRLLTELQ